MVTELAASNEELTAIRRHLPEVTTTITLYFEPSFDSQTKETGDDPGVGGEEQNTKKKEKQRKQLKHKIYG